MDLAGHPEFVSGNVHTNFIRDHYDTLFKNDSLDDITSIQAVLAILLKDKFEEFSRAEKNNNQYNPFIVEAAYRVNYEHERKIKLKLKDQGDCITLCHIFFLRILFVLVDFQFLVKFLRDGGYMISCDDGKTWCSVEGELTNCGDKTVMTALINSVRYKYNVYRNEEILAVFTQVRKISHRSFWNIVECWYLSSSLYWFTGRRLGWYGTILQSLLMIELSLGIMADSLPMLFSSSMCIANSLGERG